MAGILDFLADVGGNRELASQCMNVVAGPDCTWQDLLNGAFSSVLALSGLRA